jgi:lysophospholipase L1-like esterase
MIVTKTNDQSPAPASPSLAGRILFWLLLPITAAQGLWLRRRALRLPGAKGERRGACGRGEVLQLLAVGDSIIDGVGTESMQQALPVRFARALSQEMQRQISWRVEGESGLNISGLLQRLDELDEETTDIILISIGVNDVTGLSSTNHWRRSVGQLLDRLQSGWPDAQILFTGLPPMSQFPLPPQPLRFSLGRRATRLDSIAAQLCAERPAVTHVPTLIDPRFHSFCEDGFHPSADSCRNWAEQLARVAAQG